MSDRYESKLGRVKCVGMLYATTHLVVDVVADMLGLNRKPSWFFFICAREDFLPCLSTPSERGVTS